VEYERYARAITSALTKVEDKEVSILDIWILTSIPEDLIRELFEKNMVKVPDNIVRIVDNRRKNKVVYERS